MVIYTVKNGDSLYSISQKYNFPISRIVRDNQIENPMQLPIGLALVIMTDNVEYKVKSGDSLYTISREYGASIDSILRANPSITNPASIRSGQIINIPFTSPNYGQISVNGYATIPISPSALNPTLPYLTYMSSFSYQVSSDGSIAPLDDAAARDAAIAGGVAPLMVITNIMPNGGFDSDIAEAILTNEFVQDVLIDNIINILEEKNFYGLDIDFEYIYPRNREDYNAFLFKISDILRPMGYSVSSAVAPKVSSEQQGTLYEAHDYAAHGRALDFVTIMTYEWGYLYGPAQAIAPADQVERVISYAVTQIPSTKIFMGMPNYAYDWTLPFVQGTPARSITNREAVNIAVRYGAQIKFDPTAKAPYFNYSDSEGRRHEVWFDDARSVAARLDFVRKYNLGGVSYWNINNFFSQNWLVLSSMFGINKIENI